jgi:hypothetical protein
VTDPLSGIGYLAILSLPHLVILAQLRQSMKAQRFQDLRFAATSTNDIAVTAPSAT